MLKLLRGFALVAACGVLAAGPARAADPSPDSSTLPTRINLVAYDHQMVLDVESYLSTAIVIVRDTDGVGMDDALVELDFSECADLRIAMDGVSLDCLLNRVSTRTPASGNSGVAVFVIGGGGLEPETTPPHARGCARVLANGVLLGRIDVGTYDENGRFGVDAIDLSRLASDLFSGLDADRSDFDGDGTVSLLDLSVWMQVYFRGKSTASSSNYCP